MNAKIKILIVDDSALMRKYLREILEEDGSFEVTFARNGSECLDLIPSFDPDVITLDINMPVMDGLTCLSHIMVDFPRPVIMVSSLTTEGALATLEAIELGAVDYISKPDGTISLNVKEIRDELLNKLKMASKAKIRKSKGLLKRIQSQSERAGVGTKLSSSRTASTSSSFSARTTTSSISSTTEKQSTLSRVSSILRQKDEVKIASNYKTDVEKAPAVTSDGLVIIGVSTGGPSTLEEILPLLPENFPLPIVIAQHMPANFTKVLADRMNSLCPLNVVEVNRPMQIEASKIYIGKGDADVLIAKRGNALTVTPIPSSEKYLWHPSVDRLVLSALDCIDASKLICVQLTGMGYDGAEAMAKARQEGGKTIAESEETAVIFGMPQELIKRGGAGVVLPCHKVAQQLMLWAGMVSR